ncbi:MAG TPA: serine hydrolase domain-containing protein [Polyangiaceae bacterium]
MELRYGFDSMSTLASGLALASVEHPVRLEALAQVLVRAGVSTAAAVAAAAWDGTRWNLDSAAYGRLGAGDIEPKADRHTFFDLASLTKPIAALTAARLARAGSLEFSDPLGQWVPEANGTPSEQAPLDLLFAHRAGLAGYGALYRHLARGCIVSGSALLAEAASARRDDAPGALGADGVAPVYSDLGYLLAGEAVARAGGGDLDALMEREVLAPLGCEVGSARRVAARDAHFRRRVATTERVAWRGGCLRGYVHDENAWAFAGEGAAGHAGLFGTAEGVLRLGVAVVDVARGRFDGFLRVDELERLIRPRPLGTLRAGFDGKSERGSSAGNRFGPSTVGHLGFTGTSVWCDLERQWVGVLLTNRVHPTRTNDTIRVARPLVYDAIAAWALERSA